MSSKIDWSNQSEANQYGFLKILIPAYAVGAVIGPKGKKISDVQEETKTKVEMSRIDDYYPGTMERICLISGYKEAIFQVLQFVMKVVAEKPFIDPSPCIDYDRKIICGRGNQVKILIPNKIASKIIGFSGNTIKEIKLKSGAYVQLSQISSGVMVYERCITVMGEFDNNAIACSLILDIIVSDRSMERCLHVSYAHITHCIPNSNPVGSPIVENRTGSDDAKVDALSSTSSMNMSLPLNDSSIAQDSCRMPPSIAINALPIDINQLLESLQIMLTSSNLSDEAVTSITNALSTLNNYGVLELCLRMSLNEHCNSVSLSDSAHVDRNYYDPTPHTFRSPSLNMDNDGMFLHVQDMHAMDPNMIGMSSRPQNMFESVRDPSAFGIGEANSYASTTCHSFLGKSDSFDRIPADPGESPRFQRFDHDDAIKIPRFNPAQARKFQQFSASPSFTSDVISSPNNRFR